MNEFFAPMIAAFALVAMITGYGAFSGSTSRGLASVQAESGTPRLHLGCFRGYASGCGESPGN